MIEIEVLEPVASGGGEKFVSFRKRLFLDRMVCVCVA